MTEAVLYAREGRVAEARVFYQEALEIDVNRAGPQARERLERLGRGQ